MTSKTIPTPQPVDIAMMNITEIFSVCCTSNLNVSKKKLLSLMLVQNADEK